MHASVTSGCRRQRVLGLFGRRGLLSRETVGVMQGWGHRGGFSVHAGERVAAQDSAGRERLLRYCARPLCAAERLVWVGKLWSMFLSQVPTTQGLEVAAIADLSPDRARARARLGKNRGGGGDVLQS